jgi:tetratricopeptide (TPR) repeat protein
VIFCPQRAVVVDSVRLGDDHATEVDDIQTETIGQRLRRLRAERGLSQRELSAPGVSYAYISRIEAGARRPSVKALRKLARKLGVSAEYLETGSEIHDSERRELRLADAELRLRLGGEVEHAEAEFESLLAEAAEAGDALSISRARIGLGLLAYDRGENARAAELLEGAVESGVVSPAARPDVFATLGRAWCALGQAERAVALFERCLELVTEEAPEDDTNGVRYASYLSAALTDLGDYERAQEVLRGAVSRSDRLSDPHTRVRLYWSLGRVAGNAGRPQASLGYFRRALALLEATEHTLHLGRAHLSCAWVLLAGDQPGEAAAHLEQAEELFGTSAEQADLVMLRRHQAELALRQGDDETAVARAHEAIRLAEDAYAGERGNSWLVIAEALARQGSTADAEAAFAEAGYLLERHGTPRERASCYRAWGRLLRDAGREAEALDVLERAADFAAEIRSDGVPARR